MIFFVVVASGRTLKSSGYQTDFNFLEVKKFGPTLPFNFLEVKKWTPPLRRLKIKQKFLMHLD